MSDYCIVCGAPTKQEICDDCAEELSTVDTKLLNTFASTIRKKKEYVKNLEILEDE